jgi:hypothetical protein
MAMDLSILTDARNEGYWQQPIPSSRDLEIKALLESSDPEALVEAVRDEHYSMLRAFAERIASLAVRMKDRGVLRTGLHAVALSGLSRGSRDAVVILPLFYHAALELAVDPEEVFTAIGSLVEPEARYLLEGFTKRSPEDRSIEAMGYIVGSDSDGFRYQREW